MSATGRGATRELADLYETPASATRLVLDALEQDNSLGLPEASRWLEPSAGRGAIPQAVRAWCAERGVGQPRWTLVEARRDDDLAALAAASRLAAGTENVPVEDLIVEDFLEMPPPGEPFDLAIGNPPYRLAFEFVRKLVEERWARRVVLLLRMGFLESGARYEWLRDNVPDVCSMSSRPSFTGGATDATMYAWMVWHPLEHPRTRGRIMLLPPMSKKKAAATSGGTQ